MTEALRGKKILVTRPVGQAENLCTLIEQEGGVPVRFPALEIQPLEDYSSVKPILARLDSYALAIFVSRNAVTHALALLGDRKDALAGTQVVASGRGTASALDAAGLTSVVHGGDRADSEALLALDVLQEERVRRRHIVIFRGVGGRELLADTLRVRGAQVDVAEVYRRACPHYEDELLDRVWINGRPDQIVVTSAAALHNLFTILGPEHRGIMLDTPVVVIGERLAQTARQLGFGARAVTVAGAGDDDLLRAVLHNTRV